MSLVELPDDALQQVIAACGTLYGVPLFEEVKGLASFSQAVRLQIHRIRPLVAVTSLAIVRRPTHEPWRVALLYAHVGKLTASVVDQAQQGRVRSIKMDQPGHGNTLAPAVAARVVPELLGAGCSLIELDLWSALGGSLCSTWLEGTCFTWAAIFGEAAVSSAVLRRLRLESCGLQGPLPELRLPALQKLELASNQLTGGLEPLKTCTALQTLILFNNKLTGDLEPLTGCTALRVLWLNNNHLAGSLMPLRGCTALESLTLSHNQLTGGGLEPLRGCTALTLLFLDHNHLSKDEDFETFEKSRAHFEKHCQRFHI